MYAADRFQSVHDFLDFCDAKKPEEYYEFPDAKICACGQYFKSPYWVGMEACITASTGISLNDLANGSGVRSWHFGLLADRVRKALENAGEKV